MFDQLSPSERVIAIQRITALWALNECGLGGILHAFQSPFTGLIVGSVAMICIAMICSLAEHKWNAIMSSLIIVLIIKALVSPHTTPTAYIAVSFQAVTGALIYSSIHNLLFGSMLFATLGLIESAIQRLLVLTLLYGNNLWNAIDIWGNIVAEKWGMVLPVSSSQIIIYVYLSIHIIAGIMVGWFIYRIIKAINANWGATRYQLHLSLSHRKSFSGKKKTSRWKRAVLFIALMLLILIAYTIESGSGGIQKGLLSIVRVAVILVIWFVFLAPILIKFIQRYLGSKHQHLSAEVSNTMDMIPHLTWIIEKAWLETKQLSWLNRWKVFAVNTFLYTLQYRTDYDPHSHRTDTTS